jgi:glucose dehydrogenase
MYNGIVHVEKAERAGAKLVENAVVYKLEVGPQKQITAALYKDPQGNEHRVEGKYFVLAANGIETPKLMLMSTSHDFPNGVGNSSDMVGRNLMDHPGTGVTFYASEKLWPGRGPQEMTSLIGFRDGAFRANESGKKIHLSNLSRVDTETKKIFAQGKLLKPDELDAQIRDQAARYVEFDSFHEILPQPVNRIVPSKTETDAIGIPRPEITYQIDDYVRRSAVHTREIYATAAKVLDGTDVQFQDDFAPNNHITGATIMGSDPRDSVVDKDCRTFDHPNLFIASSGTMPTVGTVNVTLTIAALALRVADQLKKEA